MLSTTLLTVLALSAAPQAQDPHWYAFEGCWRVTPRSDAAPVVCMTEMGGALQLATYVSGELKSDQRITADGSSRAISEGGCNGEETARWSADGARVFVRAKLSCGTGMERQTTSVLALTTPESLVEVRSLKVGDGTSVRTVRYEIMPSTEYPQGFRLASGRELARETARVHASAALDVEDVVEAGKLVDAAAVEAFLAARNSGFKLTAATLRQLAAAGVPRSTLDVMIAVSYPQAFRVAEADQQQERRAEWASPYYDPFVANPYYRYDCYGLNYYSSWGCDYRYGYGYSPYGYGPYGYSRYGGWYGGYWGGNGVVIVPVDDDGNPLDGSRGGTVGGGGYTRGGQTTRGTARPRSEPSSSSGTRASVNPGSSGSGSRASSGSGSSGGSSGGSVSSGGYSSGGSSGSSQGTAKPRGGGR